MKHQTKKPYRLLKCAAKDILRHIKKFSDFVGEIKQEIKNEA